MIDEEFKDNLISMVGRMLIRRLLLPVPLRNVITAIRAVKFFRAGISSIMHGKLGVEVLDASAVAVSMAQGNFGTSSNIMFLLNLSELLESYTVKKTNSVLKDSLLIHADTVWIDDNGEKRQIPIKNLKIGDLVIVHAGVTIPVDGTVVSGEASVNQSSLTGEPLGVFKKKDDSVFAGTVIEDGSLTIEARTLPGESRINQIVDLISDSEDLKASIQGKAERIADGIVPFSFLLSLGVFAFTRNVTKALSVLLVDYSCAIKLATPISVISGMKEATTHRIVVKGGKFFEAIAQADTIIFDKTGTLTMASPTISKVVPLAGFPRTEILRYAACIEEHFPHSVARAIVKGAANENILHNEMHTEVEYIVAHGIATSINGERAIIGSRHFVFDDEKIPISQEQQLIIEREVQKDSAVFLAIGGELAGAICISNPPRVEARETIAQLRKLGITSVVMLTGDNEYAAKKISDELGIDAYLSEVLPKDKVDIVEGFKKSGHKVIMVGDGINDSPALAAADVSVSMKDSSDIAREVADITLLDSDLGSLITVRKMGQALMRRIQSNFNIIVGFNSALLLLGLGNVIAPGTLALLHNLSTIGISALGARPLLPEPIQEITSNPAETVKESDKGISPHISPTNMI